MKLPVNPKKIDCNAEPHEIIAHCNNEGYLRHYDSWTKLIASKVAEKENITMNDGHWEVVHVMRELYSRYKICPPTRILTKEMARRYGKERGSSQYLFRLFPGGLVRQAAKIAGLPKSIRCL